MMYYANTIYVLAGYRLFGHRIEFTNPLTDNSFTTSADWGAWHGGNYVAWQSTALLPNGLAYFIGGGDGDPINYIWVYNTNMIHL